MLNSCRFAAYDCYERNISLLVGERFNSIAAVRTGNNSTLVPRLRSGVISVLYLLTDAGSAACRCAGVSLIIDVKSERIMPAKTARSSALSRPFCAKTRRCRAAHLRQFDGPRTQLIYEYFAIILTMRTVCTVWWAT